MNLHIRFWINETPLRIRSWWVRHWWPAQRRLLIEERDSWKRWCLSAEEHIAENERADFFPPGEPNNA